MTKKILIISPTPTHPQNCGNRIRIYNLVSNLKKLGNEIHFLYLDLEKKSQHVKQGPDLKKMRACWCKFYYVSGFSLANFIDRSIGLAGIYLRKIFPSFYYKIKLLFYKNLSVDRLYLPKLDRFINELLKKEKIDIVLVEYIYLSRSLKNFDRSVLKVIDTHDIFTDRDLLYIKNDQKPEGFFVSANEEAKALNRADIIIAIQDKEKEFFSRLTKKKIVTIGHTVSLHKPKKRMSNDKRMLFLGANIIPNKDGVNYFIKDIFPKIKSKFPESKFTIAGSVCDSINDFDGCIKLGEVNDLNSLYNLTDIVINPVRLGTGLKIKTIEALGYAKPLITTSHSANGLENGAGKTYRMIPNINEIEKLGSDEYGYLFERDR